MHKSIYGNNNNKSPSISFSENCVSMHVLCQPWSKWLHRDQHFVNTFSSFKAFSTFSAAFLSQFGESCDRVVDSECPKWHTFPLLQTSVGRLRVNKGHSEGGKMCKEQKGPAHIPLKAWTPFGQSCDPSGDTKYPIMLTFPPCKACLQFCAFTQLESIFKIQKKADMWCSWKCGLWIRCEISCRCSTLVRVQIYIQVNS